MAINKKYESSWGDMKQEEWDENNPGMFWGCTADVSNHYTGVGNPVCIYNSCKLEIDWETYCESDFTQGDIKNCGDPPWTDKRMTNGLTCGELLERCG
ncbi:hypothetical protein COU62_01535 [Candidatus Pacearchaeota archaeon CG10_big_fil_rev_8_21_14_0_10_35_219]|nr:hypothetical protein [Candidatus Pacearchaeota archaeon]OIO43406.1 MAG: hypothetical protein AUJ63_00760 [Candidatus Pacearchaeota archaeon CG1_02_35_32]PIO08050.1 MAG: hypothetical protein COU62_01535 [Candidatus Pacearchaeota archaeon CG10_big_fil_rev_8_21_14_0_10_35_219]PIY81562.1 MAG: hypothetical protein COY79_02375 [Candidatus Pacearchaeota archaeon CG_4_10_14_0_8_um_filter_35_169]PIZ78937.1 MAG: hypothetical protein COY00_04760 [Candidatus Pacearchaeota archaeon CG_4_10_14_0_2_um_filt